MKHPDSSDYSELFTDAELEAPTRADLIRRFSIFKQYGVNVQERTSVISDARGRCLDEVALDISGDTAATADNGQINWRLSDFVCTAKNQRFARPLSFVATPITDKPVYLTIKPFITDLADDVVVSVFSWDTTGAPKPRTVFSWRIQVVTFFAVE